MARLYESGHGCVTPWGKADFATAYADGIVFYSTSSHGGFRISGPALARIPAALRAVGDAREGWFEEDCDWAIVAVAFPEFFTRVCTDGLTEYQQAVHTLMHWNQQACEQFGFDWHGLPCKICYPD